MLLNPLKPPVQAKTQAQFKTRLKARRRTRRNKWLVVWLTGFAVALLIGIGLLAVTQLSVTRTASNLISNLLANRAAVSVVDVTQTDEVQLDVVQPVEVQPVAEVNGTDSAENNEQDNEPVSEILPTEITLDIPFTSQAPHANWDLPYQEACEEASVLMAARYLLGRTIDGPDDADAAILELVNFNTDQLGQPIDTTAAETAQIIEEFYDLDTEVIYDFSWEDVKHALVAGYPVILPAAGQQLGNPNFTAPGPRYHMLVIKGYTPDHVITNDPGTRNGKDYIYKYDTLYTAAHDWNNGAVESGRKAIIIVKPSVSPAGQ